MTVSLRSSYFLFLVIGLLTSYNIKGQTISTFANGITKPAGLAFDSNGNLYIAQSTVNNPEIKKITPNGAVSTFVPSSSSEFVQPVGVAVDANNNVYFSVGNTRNRAIRKANPQGVVSSFADLTSTGSWVAGDLTFGPDGNLYAAQNVNPNRILQITPTGVVNTYVSQISSGYNGVYGTNYGVAFRNGTLYFSDNRTGAAYSRIFKVNSQDNIQAVYTSSNGLSSPSGLAFASNGDLYVANTGTNSILKITQAGQTSTFLTTAQVNTATGTGLNRPTDLAFDASGNLYISDQDNNRIVKVSVTIPPTITSFAASPNVVCSGQNVQFTATLGNVPNGYSYTLSNGAGTSKSGTGTASSFSDNLATSSEGEQTFTLSITADNQTTSSTVKVTVNALPAAFQVSGGGAYCQGSTVSIYLASSQTGVNYQLLRNGNTPIATVSGTGGELVFTTSASAGTYTIQATNTSTNCQQSMTGSAVVSVNPLPTATVSGGGSVCEGATRPDVSIALTGTGPWTITYSDGPTSKTVQGITTSPYVIAQAPAGTYTVSSVSDANCQNTGTGSVSVSVTPLPQVSLDNSGQLTCIKTTTQLTAGSSTPNVSFSFDGSGPITSQSGGSASVSQPGQYTVTATASGCSAKATTDVSQNIAPPTGVSLNSNGTLSANNPSVTLTASSNSTANVGVNYEFSQPSQKQADNQATVSISGTYSVTATRSDNGCTATAQTTVFGASNQTICYGKDGTIALVVPGSPTRYEWYQATPVGSPLRDGSAYRGTNTANLTVRNVLTNGVYYAKVYYTDGSSVTYGPFRITVSRNCGAREAVSLEPGTELRITLLGNPLQGEALKALVEGATGQPLRVDLLDLNGRPVRSQVFESADSQQFVDWNLSGSGSGLYLLQAVSGTQRHAHKVVKP